MNKGKRLQTNHVIVGVVKGSYRITIPKDLAHSLSIKKGDVVIFGLEQGKLYMERKND